MKIFIETERLLLREIIVDDETGMFSLDNDAEVHKYIGNKPVNTIEQTRDIIQFIRQQYIDNGIGRWAMIDKKTNEFIGWCGFKLMKEERNNHVDYHDLGYRLIKKYWGQGLATEAAKACVDYGFEKTNLIQIYGMADAGNKASRNVLEKAGLKYIEKFTFDSIEHDWFAITKNEWININKL